MARTHTFKGSLDSYGYGYFGYIEEGQLVLGENWPREGGITYRGPYATAGHELAELKQKAPRLYNSITKYYTDEAKKHKNTADEMQTNQTDLIKVRIKTTDGCAYDCLVKGTTEIDVTDLFTPKNNKHFIIVRTCTNQRVAININEVTAIEFLEG